MRKDNENNQQHTQIFLNKKRWRVRVPHDPLLCANTYKNELSSLNLLLRYILIYFIMNYKKQYANLIKKAKRRESPEGYSEKHHIRPRSMGGKDTKKNLVKLTAREHFVAHILLVKMYPKQYSLIKAVNMMCMVGNKQLRTNNRMYGWLREKFSKEMRRCQTGQNNSQAGTMWVYHPKTGDTKKVQTVPDGYIRGRKQSVGGGTLKPLNQSDFPMRIVKDLGTINKVRKAIFECTTCKIHFTTRPGDVKYKQQTKCNSCSKLGMTNRKGK